MNSLIITSHRNKVPQYVGTVSIILVLTILTLATVAPMHAAGLQPHGQTNVGDTAKADQASIANVQEEPPTLASMKLAQTGVSTHPHSTLLPDSPASYQPSSMIPPANYDEQLGTTFTQSFTSIAYNLTAVEQSDSNGYGPAYLLNGLGSTGYWYQVGLSYDWPYVAGGYNPGFAMIYEVFSSTGGSVFPSSGGGGLTGISVNPGDLILLSLYFSGRSVVMLAKDWNTSSTASETYGAQRATSFIGLTSDVANQNGFFTGLMTEWYHADPYYGNEGEVLYSDYKFALSSAWMWMDEFNVANGQLLFSSQTSTAVTYSSSPDQLHQFSSNGASEAGDAYEFVTGFQTIALSAVGTFQPQSADIGQSVTFTCDASGGGPPYSYSWTFGDGSTADGQIVIHSYSSPGMVHVVCTVTDNLRNTYLSTTSLTIYSDPSVSVPAASPASVDIGQMATFTTQTFGGSGGYTYDWLNTPTGCESRNASSISCEPSTAGTFQITLNVTDSNGFSVLSGALSFIVYTDPSIGSFMASTAGLDLGQGSTLLVSASGGYGALSYSFSGLPPGCATADATVLSCTPSATGNFSVIVTVTDLNGFSVAAEPVSLVVNPDPVATVVAAPSETDVGLNIAFAITASQGTGLFSYSYQGLPPGCSSSNTPSLSCTPSSSGAYLIEVSATDEAGGIATSSVAVTVNPDLSITSFSPSASSIGLGNETTLTVSVLGGTRPYSYQYSGLPPGCSSDNSDVLSCKPTADGNYTIQVSVTDYAGWSTISTVRLTVNPAGVARAFPLEQYLLIGGAIATAIAILVVTELWLRRRRGTISARISSPPNDPNVPQAPSMMSFSS